MDEKYNIIREQGKFMESIELNENENKTISKSETKENND